MEKVTTNSVEETQQFAESIARQMKGGEVLLLSGELGAGKTSFTQGFAKGLGITKRIISPTFIIMRTYDIPDNVMGLEHFFHVDLYRVHGEADVEGLGLPEIFNNNTTIVIVEWPDRLGSLKPQKRWELSLSTLGENKRQIVLNKYGY